MSFVVCKDCGVIGQKYNIYGRCSSCQQKYITAKRARYAQAYGATQGTNNSMPSTITLLWDTHLGAYKLNFPYNKGMVDFVKQTVPAGKRSYDPPSKTWFFTPEYFDAIKISLGLYFPYTSVNIFTKEEAEKAAKEWQSQTNYSNPINTASEAEKFKSFLVEAGVIEASIDINTMSKTDATKFYRKAALYYHPDRKPEFASKMSELNSIWASLKEVFFQ